MMIAEDWVDTRAQYPLYETLFCAIDRLIAERERLIIAIDGMSAAGKTTLATVLQRIYACNVFHMDGYFLRPEQKTQQRLDEIGGNVDYERFYAEVICGLARGTRFSYRTYDCKSGVFSEPLYAEPRQLNVVEGAYSLHPTLIGSYDLTVFLGIDPDTQRERIRMRNGPDLHKRFLEEWIPKENAYIEHFKRKEQSDIVL